METKQKLFNELFEPEEYPKDFSFFEDEFGNVELKGETNEYDGDGEAVCTRVYYFEKFDLYVRFNGYYSSYGGYEYDEDNRYEFVKPVEKMVTVYEPDEVFVFKVLTFNEIKNILESGILAEHDCDPVRWMDEDIPNLEDIEPDEVELKVEFLKLGNFKLVDAYGGEGKGDTYYSIYHFIDHGIYIKFDGWYQSHVGSEYSDMHEVFPQEKTIVQYNTKK